MGESFFDEHGIDREIALRRPYERWEPDARDPVKKAFESLQLPGQRRYLMQIAKKAGGWVINRHPYPGIGDSILAEIRPDVPLETGPPTWHVHPDKRTMIDPTTGERWINPATDFPLARKDIHSAKELRKHIDKPVNYIDADGAGSSFEFDSMLKTSIEVERLIAFSLRAEGVHAAV